MFSSSDKHDSAALKKVAVANLEEQEDIPRPRLQGQAGSGLPHRLIWRVHHLKDQESGLKIRNCPQLAANTSLTHFIVWVVNHHFNLYRINHFQLNPDFIYLGIKLPNNCLRQPPSDTRLLWRSLVYPLCFDWKTWHSHYQRFLWLLLILIVFFLYDPVFLQSIHISSLFSHVRSDY